MEEEVWLLRGFVHGSRNVYMSRSHPGGDQEAESWGGSQKVTSQDPPTVILLCQQDHRHKGFTSPSRATTHVPSVQTHQPVSPAHLHCGSVELRLHPFVLPRIEEVEQW